jgi:hypothetical protein
MEEPSSCPDPRINPFTAKKRRCKDEESVPRVTIRLPTVKRRKHKHLISGRTPASEHAGRSDHLSDMDYEE